MKDSLISLEQHYIDTLLPVYNIAKTAYSVLGNKWTEQQRKNFSSSISKEQIERIRQLNLGKTLSDDTRELIRLAALNRPVSEVTRAKMSANNNKNVGVTAYYVGTTTVYRTFPNMSEAAKFFYSDVKFRKEIRKDIDSGAAVLGKYTLVRT